MAGRWSGRGRRATALALLLSLPLSGCYSLSRVDPARPAPAPGTRVVVALTDAGTQQVASALGPGVVAVDGMLEAATPAGYALLVRAVEKRNGEQDFWDGEPVTVPASAVAGVSVRRLDRGRTLLLAGAVAVGAVLVGRSFGSGTIFGGDPGGGGPTPGN